VLDAGGDRAVHPDAMQNIDATAWIAPSAQLFGALTIEAGASVWHNAVMRAECQAIRVGRMTNIQDFAMVHVAYDRPTVIGAFCSITHHVTIHGCTIEDECLVGIGATIMDGARIGRGSIVAGGAFVKEGTVIPPASIVAGVPAKVVRTRNAARDNRLNAWQYHRNAQHYRRGHHRAWEGLAYERWLVAKQAQIATDADLEVPITDGVDE
jgi:carbonic anhydrase/acetyltransferase-like protein (isoleucine patch superfamily)